MPLTPTRLKDLKDVIEHSITPVQFESRHEIFKRLVNYVKKSSSEEELYANLLSDFPAWCATFLNNDNGKPIFLALWQQEYAGLMDSSGFSWCMACRKVGKSTLLSAWILHKTCKERKRVISYAPTWKQDFVYKDVLRFLRESEFLYDKYIARGGSDTKSEIQLKNRSEIINRTIGLQTKGELTLGEKADIVTVDEIELIEKAVFIGIIRPILIDAYSEKHLAIIGTPKLDANPVLDQDWDAWLTCTNHKCLYRWSDREMTCPKCKTERTRMTLTVDYLRGVEEGCLNKEAIEGQMSDMTEDEIDMWFRARFPAEYDRFYPRVAMYDCARKELDFLQRPMPGKKYIMSADYAKYVDRTELLVAEADDQQHVLKYVYWKRFDPKKQKIDPDMLISFTKNLFWSFNCHWIIIDASNTQEDVYLKGATSGDNAIPPGRFYKDERDRLGYVASGPRNYEMHLNHKRQILNGAIRVPRQEPFLGKWVNQHVRLQATQAHGGQYIKLTEMRNSFKDLAITSAMLSLYLLKPHTPPFMGISTW